MIKAKHTRFMTWFYNWYARYAIHRHFSKVVVEGRPLKTSKPLLIISNHHSWWDGFFILYLNQKYIQKKFFVMMLEEQLLKHKSFRKTGAFSVRKGNRSVMESVDYARDLLKDPQNMVLLFPQGAIQSQHIETIHFQKGVQKVWQEMHSFIDVLMVVSLTDYYSTKKDQLYLYSRFAGQDVSIGEQFNIFYQQCKQNQKP